jgi:hypothetical protein
MLDPAAISLLLLEASLVYSPILSAEELLPLRVVDSSVLDTHIPNGSLERGN